MLGKRLATGFALAAFAIGMVVWAPFWSVTLVVMAVAGVCLHEYVGMAMAKDAPGDRHATMGLGLAVVACMSGGPAGAAAGLSLALVASATHTLFRFGNIDEALGKMAVRWTGIVYCGFFFGHYLLLRPQPHGWQLILTTFVASFLGDTAAYFSGRRFGKTPLYPAVSPKKTVEGALGGLAGSIVGVLVAKLLYFDALGYPAAFLFGAFFGAVGQVGDLIESLMKRSTGVKDSGHLLPGHGGFMDRIDSIVLSAPVVCWLGPRFL